MIDNLLLCYSFVGIRVTHETHKHWPPPPFRTMMILQYTTVDNLQSPDSPWRRGWGGNSSVYTWSPRSPWHWCTPCRLCPSSWRPAVHAPRESPVKNQNITLRDIIMHEKIDLFIECFELILKKFDSPFKKTLTSNI